MSSDAVSATSTAFSNALPAGTRIRDYTIVSVIGTGGFSIVYKAIDNALMREVAIKEYFPGNIALRDNEGTVHAQTREVDAFRKGIESFLNEGKLLAQFDHPALVRVYRCWEERGTAYLAMRLYSGVTLRDAVKSGSWSPDEQSLPALLLPVCEALDVLHAAHCFHRDVAPDNILLGENNWPVLLDFGAARKAIEGTQVFTAILKPGYAPIEQYGEGELKQGPWTDIYALAGVVYFTLSGNAPTTAISRMLRDSMPPPRDAFAGRLPERWLDAIGTSLAVKPESRPQSIAEFISLLGWDEMPASVADIATRVVQSTPPPDIATLPSTTATTVVMTPAARLADDDHTVVVPRVIKPQPQAAILQTASDAAIEVSTIPVHASPSAHSSRSRFGFGLRSVAALVLVAAALLGGWLLSSHRADTVAPAKSTLPVQTDSNSPLVPPGNDTSVAPKTSLPVDTPSTPPSTPGAATEPASQPVTPFARPTEPVTSTPEIASKPASPKPERKAETKSSARPSATAQERSARPARCLGLLDRWQLGAALSDEEQRFLTEKCK